MIIDVQKEQTYFEAEDVLRIKDGDAVTAVFKARWAGATPTRCEFCHFADNKENCSLQPFCFDTRFLDLTQEKK